jgi:LytS/YehU family sensor histidine kinase
MSTIINRFLRKKSVRNEEALALANRLSFGNSQCDRFLMDRSIEMGSSAYDNYRVFQKEMLLLEHDRKRTIAEELELLTRYFELVNSLMPGGFLLKWDNRFQSAGEVLIPPLILFPLIQHAVSNGYNRLLTHPIRVRLSGSARLMLLEVSHRMNHYLDGQFNTILVEDFQQRLEFLFPGRHSLLLNSNSNTSKATLTIHL